MRLKNKMVANALKKKQEEKEKEKSIKELAQNLIKAIKENTISVQLHENDFGPAVPSQYIADELEELQEALK